LRVGARRPHRLLSASVGLSPPTIWGRRLAYVSGPSGVFVRGMRWPSTRPSVARPGVPRRACEGRRRTASGTVGELELRNHTLALVVGFGADELDDGGQQVRVDDTVTGVTWTIQEIGNGGLSGYVIGAVSFARRWLGWRGLCTADSGGCSDSSQIYRARGRRRQTAAGHYVPAVGFALTRHGSLQVIARGEFGLRDPAEACRGPVSPLLAHPNQSAAVAIRLDGPVVPCQVRIEDSDEVLDRLRARSEFAGLELRRERSTEIVLELSMGRRTGSIPASVSPPSFVPSSLRVV
jgi:hypothetical protein